MGISHYHHINYGKFELPDAFVIKRTTVGVVNVSVEESKRWRNC